jgi:transposase-like protein
MMASLRSSPAAPEGAESNRRPRSNHSAAFEAKSAIAARQGEHGLAAIAQQFAVHPNQITQWKVEPLERASVALAVPSRNAKANQI